MIVILATAKKNIDDNLKPAIDLLHSWGWKYNWKNHRTRRQSIGWNWYTTR